MIGRRSAAGVEEEEAETICITPQGLKTIIPLPPLCNQADLRPIWGRGVEGGGWTESAAMTISSSSHQSQWCWLQSSSTLDVRWSRLLRVVSICHQRLQPLKILRRSLRRWWRQRARWHESLRCPSSLMRRVTKAVGCGVSSSNDLSKCVISVCVLSYFL